MSEYVRTLELEGQMDVYEKAVADFMRKLRTEIPSASVNLRRPPYETFVSATCRGCYALGTACGHCEACTWELNQIRERTGKL
jgi:hypothetical protein